MTALAIKSHTETLADVLLRLGSVPTDRIAAYPAPGSATEADLLSPRSEDRLMEQPEPQALPVFIPAAR